VIAAVSTISQPVPLVEGPPPYVLLERAGRFLLTLEIVLPLASSAGTESIALPASPSPISRTALVLPKSGVDLLVSGGFIADHTEAANESRWTAFGRPNQPLTLSWNWSPRTEGFSWKRVTRFATINAVS
jgi:hypothetical protein